MTLRIRAWLLQLLGITDHAGRLSDLERHFVTKRHPETGQPVETLADVPLAERKEKLSRPRGMSWAQQKQWLEATDGGRRPSN